MLIGYARVSTHDQTLNLQKDALQKIGCISVFADTASGNTAERPGLSEALKFLREGDVLVVWRLDRLGRSLPFGISLAYHFFLIYASEDSEASTDDVGSQHSLTRLRTSTFVVRLSPQNLSFAADSF